MKKAKRNGFERRVHRGLLCGAAIAALLACTRHADGAPAATGAAKAAPDAPVTAYAPNTECVECHAEQASAWRTSHHHDAMARADEGTVLGDFSGVEFEHGGVRTKFFRRDGRYFVRTDGEDGKAADFEVAYTFGVDPLQQYLIALSRGRVQALTVAWDTRRKRWFTLYPDEKTPPGDVLHWTGRYQNWNSMCASCHTTNLRKNYDPGSDSYATTWSEINVSCQSCHGAGAEHVARVRAKRADAAAALVTFSGDPRRETDVCAPCHARRTELDAAPAAGAPLYDNYLPALLTEPLYYADGQQHDEVYVYGSYVQTKMYEKGVRCTDCHDPHTAKLRAEGNALCVRCHQPEADKQRFPTLAAKAYDTRAHHFHEPGKPGSACVECHMPENTYMLIDARRDHAIRVPRPDLSVKLDTPNACSQCHADRGAKWAADAVARWYPASPRSPGYAETLFAGRAGSAGAESALAELAGDKAEPAIVRATALDLLTGYGAASLPATITATRDADPGVRTSATASLERLAPAERLPLVAPLLADPIRMVRIEAARVLSAVPREAFDEARRRAYEAARAEFIAVQNATLEAPGSHLNLAVLAANENDPKTAEAQYRSALALDPDFTPARLNLAQLLDGLGRTADAVTVLQEGIARIPAQGELHYSLGLALAAEKRFDDATRALAEASKLLPDRARIAYNLGLVLQHVGKASEAETALARAQTLDPGDPEIVYALTLLYAQQSDWQRAIASGEKLQQLVPGNEDVGKLLAELRGRAAGKAVPAPGAPH